MSEVRISSTNILKVYRQATSAELAEGREWYPAARTFAAGLATEYRLTMPQAAGIIAVLSPRLRWRENMMYADMVCRTGSAPTLRCNVDKAERILEGPWEVSGVLMCAQCRRDIFTGKGSKHVCTGQKVRAFYRNILGLGDYVCVDRHAFDIAAGRVTDDVTRKLLDRVGGYEKVQETYRRAAKVVGESPSTVQAITWVTWRNRKGGAK